MCQIYIKYLIHNIKSILICYTMPLYLKQYGNMNRQAFEMNQRTYIEIDLRTYRNLLYNKVEISKHWAKVKM